MKSRSKEWYRSDLLSRWSRTIHPRRNTRCCAPVGELALAYRWAVKDPTGEIVSGFFPPCMSIPQMGSGFSRHPRVKLVFSFQPETHRCD
jgi:hypothetical protein